MNGVEILAMEEVVVAYEFSWPIYIGVIFVLAIIFGFICYFITTYPRLEDALIGMFVGVLIGVVIGLLPASYLIPSEYETRYKVTISDETTMNDFLSNYEIVDQEGKIYTVVERNKK